MKVDHTARATLEELRRDRENMETIARRAENAPQFSGLTYAHCRAIAHSPLVKNLFLRALKQYAEGVAEMWQKVWDQFIASKDMVRMFKTNFIIDKTGWFVKKDTKLLDQKVHSFKGFVFGIDTNSVWEIHAFSGDKFVTKKSGTSELVTTWPWDTPEYRGRRIAILKTVQRPKSRNCKVAENLEAMSII